LKLNGAKGVFGDDEAGADLGVWGMARVLIVEDEGILAMNLVEMVEGMGHEVVGVADSGAKALKLADVSTPDLVLLDIVIKGETDGVTLGNLLHQAHGCMLIYITGSPEVLTAEIAHWGILNKPLSYEELAPAIEAVLGS